MIGTPEITNYYDPPRIEPGVLEILLQGGSVRHTAWDHFGMVTFENGRFREEVWVRHELVEIIEADNLEALIGLVNGKWGSD